MFTPYNRNISWHKVYDHHNGWLQEVEVKDYEVEQETKDESKTQGRPNFFGESDVRKKIQDTDQFKNMQPLDLLKEEYSVMQFLNRYVIQNNCLDMQFFLNILGWCQAASDELAFRLKQRKFMHSFANTKSSYEIPRNSYKFCNFKHDCQYNYDDDSKKGCCADHYVHDKVSADMDSVIRYVKHNYKGDTFNQNKEIIKCINTIMYVIKHMFEELSNVTHYAPKSMDPKKLHRNRKMNGQNRKNKKRGNNRGKDNRSNDHHKKNNSFRRKRFRKRDP